MQGCRNGESCFFSHDLGSSTSFSLTSTLPEEDDYSAASLLHLFPTSSDGCILLLDDIDLHFTSNIAHHYDASKIISTTCMSETAISYPSLEGARILWGLHHPQQTIVCSAGRNPIPWNEIKCILWFPNLDGNVENLERDRILVQNFFEHLAIRIIADSLYELQIIITMNNIRFSLLQVIIFGKAFISSSIFRLNC